MKRTFITAISLQPHGNLRKVTYEPQEFELPKNRETSFPIIPIIEEYMGPDKEEVEVIAIIPYSKNALLNYESFKEELEWLGLNKEAIKEIRMGEKQDKKESVQLLMNLLDAIPEDSLVYADITYNTKPMSAMVVYAMEFIEKMKDTEVTGIYYGELARDYEGKPVGSYLYDITMFKHLSGIMDQLQILEIKDTRAAFGRLLGM